MPNGFPDASTLLLQRFANVYQSGTGWSRLFMVAFYIK